jgi:hypothetical protein
MGHPKKIFIKLNTYSNILLFLTFEILVNINGLIGAITQRKKYFIDTG